MKLQRIVQAVYFEPMAITREGWLAIHSIVKSRLARDAGVDLPLPQARFREDGSIDESTDFWGEPLPKMEIGLDGVAMIPIVGPLIHHASLIEKQCGACSYDDIKRDVEIAGNTPGIRKAVFFVSSPGGQCVGSHETGKVIDQLGDFMPTEAVTDSVMGSAAYDIVCGCRRIRCTPTAVVGCIGSMLAWLDESVRYEMAGLKMKVFADGIYKGMGTEGTSLTPAQEQELMRGVLKYSGMFKDRVRAHRLVEESSMQGQTFIGSDAVDAGLVDELVDDIDVAMEMPPELDCDFEPEDEPVPG